MSLFKNSSSAYCKMHYLALMTMVVLSVFSTDLYLASFLEIASYFNITLTRVQLTQTTYLLGYAFSIPFLYLVADSYGRKTVLLISLGCFIVGCCIGFYATAFYQLILCRILQSIGGSSASIISRVIVKETSAPNKVMSYLASFFISIAVGLIVAPAAGGYVQKLFGWRGQFFLLGIIAFVFLICTWLTVKESLTDSIKKPLQFRHFFDDFKFVWKEPLFFHNTGIMSLLWSGLFVYLSVAPFVIIRVHEQPPEKFGVLLAISMLGFILGNVLSKKQKTSILSAIYIHVFSAIAILLFRSCLGFVICGIFYLGSIGSLLPLLQANAIKPFSGNSSPAFSWLYLTKMGFAAIVVQFVALCMKLSTYSLYFAFIIISLVTFGWIHQITARKKIVA